MRLRLNPAKPSIKRVFLEGSGVSGKEMGGNGWKVYIS